MSSTFTSNAAGHASTYWKDRARQQWEEYSRRDRIIRHNYSTRVALAGTTHSNIISDWRRCRDEAAAICDAHGLDGNAQALREIGLLGDKLGTTNELFCFRAFRAKVEEIDKALREAWIEVAA